MLKHQVTLQPGFVVFGPFGHIHPTVRPALHRAQGHQDHFRQIAPLRRSRAQIRQISKSLRQCHFYPRQKSRADLIQSGPTRPCHNPLAVNNFPPGFTTSAYAMALYAA